MNPNAEPKNKPRQNRRMVGAWTVVGVLLIIALGLLVGLMTGRPGFLFGGKVVRAERFHRKGLRYLELRNSTAAVEQFRLALKEYPEHLDAYGGLVRALAMKRDFAEALQTLQEARQHGYPDAEAAFLQADILLRRAEHRISAAGADVTPALCLDVIAKEIAPAIKLCEDNAPRLRRPEEGYVILGNLEILRGRCLELRRRGLVREAETARVLKQEALRRDRIQQAQEALRGTRTAAASAAAAYRKALSLNENTREARLALAGMLVQDFVPRPREAMDLVKPILARRPDDQDALRIMAHALRLSGDPEASLRLLKNIPPDKRDVSLTILQAQALADLGRWAEVDTCLASIAGGQPQFPGAALLRGKALLRLDRPSEAAILLQNIFRDPNVRWSEARYELAQALLKIGSKEQALDQFRKVFDDANLEEVANQEGALRQREAKYGAALALARESMVSSPSQALEYAARALRLFPDRAEALELAREACSRVQDGNKTFAQLLTTHIWGIAASGRVDAALERTREELARPGAPVPILRRLMAKLLVEKGSYRDAIATYEQLWNDFPNVADYGLELARLKVRLGQYADALTIYDSLLERRPPPLQAAAEKATTLMMAGRHREASEWLRDFAAQHGVGLTHDWLLHLYMVEGHREDAVALARSQADAMPNKSQPQATLGEILLREGNLAEARDRLERARALDPLNRNAYTLGLLELAEGNTSAAVSVFADAVKVLPDWLPAKMYGAFALCADGRTEEAASSLRDILSSAPPQDANWDLPRWVLAITLVASGDMESATRMNSQVVGDQFGTTEDRKEFIEALSALQPPQRREAVQKTALLLTLCYAALDRPAAECQRALDALVPNQLLPRYWLAQALEKAGKRGEAEALYEDMLATRAGFLAANLALARLHMQRGDLQKGIKLLEEALATAEGPTAASIHAWLGKGYEESDEWDTALAHYEEALKTRPNDPVLLNNIAWLLATGKRNPAAALPYATEAARLAPNQPHILDTLGWILYLNGDAEKAVSHLELAKKGLPNVSTVRYHLGMVYLALGQRDAARAEMEDALTLSENFDEAEQAREVLATLAPRSK